MSPLPAALALLVCTSGCRSRSTEAEGRVRDTATGSDTAGDADTAAATETGTDTDTASDHVPQRPEIDLVYIEPGAFQFGDPNSTEGQVSVSLTRAYYIGSTELTRGQFQAVLGMDPTQSCVDGSPDCPVDSVNWSTAAWFTVVLSELDGLEPCYTCQGIPEGAWWPSGDPAEQDDLQCWHTGNPYACEGWRLPTMVEQEYGARAGVTSNYLGGGELPEGDYDTCVAGVELTNGTMLDDYAWHCGNSGGEVYRHDARTRPVGLLLPNAWGLYDVQGNVTEWAADACEMLWGDQNPPGGADPVVMEDPLGAWYYARSGLAGSVFSGPAMVGVTYRGCGFDMWMGLMGGGVGMRIARTAPSGDTER